MKVFTEDTRKAGLLRLPRFQFCGSEWVIRMLKSSHPHGGLVDCLCLDCFGCRQFACRVRKNGSKMKLNESSQGKGTGKLNCPRILTKLLIVHIMRTFWIISKEARLSISGLRFCSWESVIRVLESRPTQQRHGRWLSCELLRFPWVAVRLGNNGSKTKIYGRQMRGVMENERRAGSSRFWRRRGDQKSRSDDVRENVTVLTALRLSEFRFCSGELVIRVWESPSSATEAW